MGAIIPVYSGGGGGGMMRSREIDDSGMRFLAQLMGDNRQSDPNATLAIIASLLRDRDSLSEMKRQFDAMRAESSSELQESRRRFDRQMGMAESRQVAELGLISQQLEALRKQSQYLEEDRKRLAADLSRKVATDVMNNASIRELANLETSSQLSAAERQAEATTAKARSMTPARLASSKVSPKGLLPDIGELPSWETLTDTADLSKALDALSRDMKQAKTPQAKAAVAEAWHDGLSGAMDAMLAETPEPTALNKALVAGELIAGDVRNILFPLRIPFSKPLDMSERILDQGQQDIRTLGSALSYLEEVMAKGSAAEVGEARKLAAQKRAVAEKIGRGQQEILRLDVANDPYGSGYLSAALEALNGNAASTAPAPAVTPEAMEDFRLFEEFANPNAGVTTTRPAM